MPVSNGFGSRNFGIIAHSITVGSIPLARSAARARRPFDRPPSLCDPDEQVQNFGRGGSLFGQGGPSVQFGGPGSFDRAPGGGNWSHSPLGLDSSSHFPKFGDVNSRFHADDRRADS